MDKPFFPAQAITGQLARKMDWARHPLGPLPAWPIALNTAVSIVFNSHFPMFFTWGKERSFFYNDAYIPVLGAKHPSAFGAPFEQVWEEIWPELFPLVMSVDKGEAVYLENLKLKMNRNGFDEETFFTFSYSPLRNEEHEIKGLLCACIETTAQLRAHEELSRSEASLKLALASAEMGTWEVSLSNGKVKFSPEAHHIFGYASAYEDSTSAIDACVHPADRARVQKNFQAAIGAQVAYSDDYRILRPNGEVRWIHSRGRTRWDEREQQHFFTGLIIDITERKAATRAVEESEARFRQISEALPQLVWTAHPDGGVDYLSPQWVAYTGVQEASQLGNGWYHQVLHPEDRARVAAHWAGALAGKHPYDIEYRLKAKEGGYRWFKARATAIRSAHGDTLYWFGTSTDIDNYKTAQLNFERNVDVSPAILWITEKDGSCTYLSKQWYDYTGQTEAEALGFGWLGATHPDDKARAGDIFVTANAAEGPFYTEYRLRTRDGQYRWAIDAGNPRYDKDGAYCGYAGTVIDVHDRKLAEIRIEAERQKFEAIFVDSAASMALLRGPNFIFEKINPRYKALLGDRELIGHPIFEVLPELHGLPFKDYMREVFATGKPYVATEMPVKLIRRPGGVPETTYLDFTYTRVEDGQGLPYGIYIHAIEVTDQVLAREALKLQSEALALALSEAPLPEVLATLVRIIEQQAPEATLASILTLDSEGKRLLTGAAPSLPAEYNAIVHGMEIGNDRGSCGTAAYLSQTVIAADIATDPRWAAFKDIALKFGLASCWSSPIISSENKVLGTFALYRPQPGEPTGNDRKLVEVATRTAAIILERHEANEKRRAAEIALRTSQERLALSLTSGGIGFWEWNAKTGYVFLSETLMDDWGIDPAKFQNTLPECLERIHPE
ncbi:MAG: PAS domain S-box protein, partial [Proteobacteria bacterium]